MTWKSNIAHQNVTGLKEVTMKSATSDEMRVIADSDISDLLKTLIFFHNLYD